VLTYDLKYVYGPVTGNSRLKSVSVNDAHGNRLPPSTFTWQDADPAILAKGVPIPASDIEPTTRAPLPADLTGCGIAKLVQAFGVEGKASPSLGFKVFDLSDLSRLKDGATVAPAIPKWSKDASVPTFYDAAKYLLMDVNGDGATEVVYSTFDLDSGTWKFNVIGFTQSSGAEWTCRILGRGTESGGPDSQLVPMDFNGDGRTDLLVASGNVSLELSLLKSDGAGFKAGRHVDVGDKIPAGGTCLALDFNGSGMVDLLYAYQDGAARTWRFVLFLSDGTTLHRQPAAPLPTGTTIAPGSTLIALDVNGDGLMDVVHAYVEGNKLTIATIISNGISFEAPKIGRTDLSTEGIPLMLPCLAFGDKRPQLLIATSDNSRLSLSLFHWTGNPSGGLELKHYKELDSAPAHWD